MILSDKDIKEHIKKNELSIEQFSEENLTPNGYDLSIGEINVQKFRKEGYGVGSGKIAIPPKTCFLISTKEYLKIGKKLCAHLWLKSTYARKGIFGAFGYVDAGFEGNLILSAYNASARPIMLNIGDKFVQIVFETFFSEPEKLYEERSGSYMRQGGLVSANISEGKPCIEHKCNTCCLETEMVLTEEDIERIKSLGYEEKMFVVNVDNWLQLKNTPDGKCFFLSDNFCLINAHKPEGCKFYPLIYDSKKNCAVLDKDCPYVNEYNYSDEDEKKLIQLIDKLKRERRGRR
ncbi:MAG: dCTP deaminase [Candidatus Thermoplasmatota archaeon]